MKNSTAVLKLADLVMETSTKEVRKFLKAIGDSPTTSIEEEIGESGLKFVAVNRTPNNSGPIRASSSNVRALAERLKNGEDSMLELMLGNYLKGNSQPVSPVSAAELACGRPSRSQFESEEVFVEALDKWLGKSQGVALAMHNDGIDEKEVRSATIDIIDRGEGIPNSSMADTILSLNRDNKSNKHYLSGTFGQGGSASLAFCEYTLIASKSYLAPNQMSVTLIRKVTPRSGKISSYAYLANMDGSIPVVRANIRCPYEKIVPEIKGKAVPDVLSDWPHGTLVRHYSYDVSGRSNPQGGDQMTLFQSLNFVLPYPVLGLRFLDTRRRARKSREKHLTGYGSDVFDQRISGVMVRLLKKTVWEDKHKIKILHDDRFEVNTGFVDDNGRRIDVPVRFWVVECVKNNKLAPGHQVYFEKGKQIVFLKDGQNHGAMGLMHCPTPPSWKYLTPHFVCIIDLTGQPPGLVDSILASTRESVRESNTLRQLLDNVTDELANDARLAALEAEFKERYKPRGVIETDEDERKAMKELLSKLGLLKMGRTLGGETPPRNPSEPRFLPIIKTLPFPKVSFMVVKSPGEGFSLKSSMQVCVETDASDALDPAISIKIDGPAEVASTRPLSGGRKYWRIKPANYAKLEDKVAIHVSLRPKDKMPLFSQSVHGSIGSPLHKPGGFGTKPGAVMPETSFSFVSIREDQDLFDRVFSSKGVDFKKAAFDYEVDENKISIYCNSDFEPFVRARTKASKSSTHDAEKEYQRLIRLACIRDFSWNNKKPCSENEESDKNRLLGLSSAATCFVATAFGMI